MKWGSGLPLSMSLWDHYTLSGGQSRASPIPQARNRGVGQEVEKAGPAAQFARATEGDRHLQPTAELQNWTCAVQRSAPEETDPGEELLELLSTMYPEETEDPWTTESPALPRLW